MVDFEVPSSSEDYSEREFLSGDDAEFPNLGAMAEETNLINANVDVQGTIEERFLRLYESLQEEQQRAELAMLYSDMRVLIERGQRSETGSQDQLGSPPVPNRGTAPWGSRAAVNASGWKSSALKAIPQYNGKMENDTAWIWIRKVETHFEKERFLGRAIGSESEQLELLQFKLVGAAKLRWNNRKASDGITTVEEFKTWVLKNFADTDPGDLFQELMSMKQGQKSVRVFAHEFETIASRISHQLPNRVLIMSFRQGIRPELQEVNGDPLIIDSGEDFARVVEIYARNEKRQRSERSTNRPRRR